MKLWKLKDFERKFLFMVREQVPMVAGTENFWQDLAKKLAVNAHLTQEEFAALYYATVLVYNAYLHKEPKLLIGTLDVLKDPELDLDSRFEAPTYEKMIQTLYITLAMGKPNGKEFCEGSLKFSEQEYDERRKLIEDEISDMKAIAEKYVSNLDKVQVKTIQKNR